MVSNLSTERNTTTPLIDKYDAKIRCYVEYVLKVNIIKQELAKNVNGKKNQHDGAWRNVLQKKNK